LLARQVLCLEQNQLAALQENIAMEELAAQVAALVAQAAEAAARERSWRAEAQQQQTEWNQRANEREVLFQQEMTRVSAAAQSAEQDARDEILDLQRRLLSAGTTGGPTLSKAVLEGYESDEIDSPTLSHNHVLWEEPVSPSNSSIEAVCSDREDEVPSVPEDPEEKQKHDDDGGKDDPTDVGSRRKGKGKGKRGKGKGEGKPDDEGKGFEIRQRVAREWVESLLQRRAWADSLIQERGWCCAKRNRAPPTGTLTMAPQQIVKEEVEVVMGTPTNRGHGLEAWRRLPGPARLRQNLTHILTPERLTLKTMSVGILQWEEKVRGYEHRTKEALSERVRASVLTSMTAGHGPLKEHLELNAGRLKTYAAIREEITLYLDGKNDTAASSLRSNAAPMDVGSVGQQPGGGAPGSTGKGPIDGCWTCGGPHYSRDCPCPYGSKGKDDESDESYDQGRDPYAKERPKGKGKGKSKSKGKKGKKGKKGAGAQQRGVNVIDQDNEETAAEADVWDYGDEWTPQEEQVEKELGGLCCVPQEVGLNSLGVAAKDLDVLALEYATTGVVRVTVDSGAAGSVMPPYICPKEETLAPTNVRYRTASGNFLYNQGTRKIRTQHGVFRFGLADVTKPLLSVGEVVAKGHTVVMNADGGYIEIKDPTTGERKKVPMKLQDGVFVIELRPRRIPPKQTVQLMPVAIEEAASPFHRQIPRL
jgi:hypothetical protein